MKRFPKALVGMAAVLCLAQGAFAQSGESRAQKVALRQDVPSVVHRSAKLEHVRSDKAVHITVALPLRDPEGLQKFVDDVSDPKSPNYGRFLTPDQVGERFGLAKSQIEEVETYLRSQGFKIKLVGKNRLGIMAEGTVAQAEAAFNTVINEYRVNNPQENGRGRYFAYSSALQVPATVAPYVRYVSGLENFTKPMAKTMTPTQARMIYGVAPMYTASKQGQGRKVGISNWDGYRLSNVPLWYTQYGLPAPVGGVGSNIHVVSINGSNGNTSPNVQGEADLDIQMVLGQAPLCDLYIYDNADDGDLLGLLTKMSNDNLVDIVSESWGWQLPTSYADAVHNLHVTMNAQGITYMAASGDFGTTIEPFAYPDYDPEVLLVGGTVVTTDGAGNRTSEVGWAGSGGGWGTETNTWNIRPSWQTGNGVPTNVNKRLIPDVAGAAGGGAYFVYYNGSLFVFDGTSCSSPVFAGGLAVAQQQLIANGVLTPSGGLYRMGRIQDLIYSHNGRSDVWFDVTSGSNGNLPDSTSSTAKVGWDYVTGWGAINWNGFVNSFFSVSVNPSTVTSGTSSTGTVRIAIAAPAGGTVVALSSSDPAASVPATVTVAQGATTATFPITTSNSGTTQISATITATLNGNNVSTVLKVNPANNSQFIGQTVPSSMVSGQTYTVRVQFKNTGLTTWTSANGIKLRSVNPLDNTYFAMNRLPLLNGPVAPGGTANFGADVLGSGSAGVKNFQWQCIQEGIGTFGPTSTAVPVTVTVEADAARYMNMFNVPATINAGTDFVPQVKYMNVGTATWTSAAGYKIVSRSPYLNTNWGTSSVAVPGSTAKGGTVLVSTTMTAPTTPGVYAFQWSMSHNSTPFGDLSKTISVNVVNGPDNAKPAASGNVVPVSVGPGTTFNATVVMTNLGTATWDSASGYSLTSYGNGFGPTSLPVAGSVTSGSNATFSQSFTAPASAGTYHFKWRMTHNGTPFGLPIDIVVTVSADASQFVTRSGATTVNAGADFYCINTMKNTGTTTWSAASGYNMISQNPANNATFGYSTLNFPNSNPVAPGAQVTILRLLTAPTTPGTYNLQWQMAKSGVAFGEKTPNVVVTVVQGPDNALYVSQTGVPTTIARSTTFNATITMKNAGTATWDGTYTLVPVGNNTWGVPSIASGSVAPNANGAFSATFTAPATPGTYTFQMRMKHGTPLFGAKTPLVTITVT